MAGDDWEQAIARAEKLIQVAYKWAEESKVKFEDEKMEWIRWGKDGKKKDKEEIELPYGTLKEEKESIKWLGILLDNKLDFKNHVREKTARPTRAAHNIIGLGRGTQGMGVDKMRKMYIVSSRQVLEYGGKVWWKG